MYYLSIPLSRHSFFKKNKKDRKFCHLCNTEIKDGKPFFRNEEESLDICTKYHDIQNHI